MSFREENVCPNCFSKEIVFNLPPEGLKCGCCNWKGFSLKIIRKKIDYREKEKICHDCGTNEGDIHYRGCDMERCPFCGGQLISCSCCYKQLGYEYNWNKEYCGLPEEIYKNGLSEKDQNIWESILVKKGRIPYILFPNICAMCGVLWPIMFHSKKWKEITYPYFHNDMLCQSCFTILENNKNYKNKKANFCDYCGILNPITDSELKESIVNYIEPLKRERLICNDCCQHIFNRINEFMEI